MERCRHTQLRGSKKQMQYKKIGNNIAVDPADLVILSKAKYLCSVWL